MSNIDFKCPHGEFSCVHIDTCSMSVEKSCQECEHNPQVFKPVNKFQFQVFENLEWRDVGRFSFYGSNKPKRKRNIGKNEDWIYMNEVNKVVV